MAQTDKIPVTVNLLGTRPSSLTILTKTSKAISTNPLCAYPLIIAFHNTTSLSLSQLGISSNIRRASDINPYFK
ncbi:hypothetical protein Scep_002383 [Stephania cephalantha]|uniref:Uncharacterized protein n=1 Tax=Stephania cephalantha TaxID=152367 RepID=A0AAP0LBB9_9MAGN